MRASQAWAIMVAKNVQDLENIRAEHFALGTIGIRTKLLGPDEIRSFFSLREFLGGITFDVCAQVHPAQFAAGLARSSGLEVYENSTMNEWEETNGSVVLKTPNGKITCSSLVLAANYQNYFDMASHFKVESSVILASQPLDRIEDVWPKEKIIWSMEEKYDLIYPRDGRAILELYKLGGEKSKLAYYYPGIDFRIEQRWGDVWAKTGDWLPIVGKVAPSVVIATGTKAS